VTGLGEELLLVALSPVEGRNTRLHDGIRAALCAAAVLDHWVAGSALPPEKDLRKYVRKHNFATLEPALASLASSGRVATSVGNQPPSTGPAGLLGAASLRARYDWLADQASGAAVRARLTGSLSGPSVPARHDAALAVLLYSARLWDWAGLDPPGPKSRLTGRSLTGPGPLATRAGMLAAGTVIPDGAAATDLPSVARIIDREVRDYSD
jgi:hypothetical protein